MLIHADGEVNEKEIFLGQQLIEAEKIVAHDFNQQMDSLKLKDSNAIFSECISELKKLDRRQQIRSIAWSCVVANADGFMDKTEWQLIYKIYHKELQLPLDEIFVVQKQLGQLIHDKSPNAKNVSAAAWSPKKGWNKKSPLQADFFCGEYRSRTDDLFHAMEAR